MTPPDNEVPPGEHPPSSPGGNRVTDTAAWWYEQAIRRCAKCKCEQPCHALLYGPAGFLR